MKTHLHPTHIDQVHLFQLKKNTALKIRIDDPTTRRYQFVELKRRDDDKVKVTLRDYAGDLFCVEIALSNSTARITSPDFSIFDAADAGEAVVLSSICKILAEHRS